MTNLADIGKKIKDTTQALAKADSELKWELAASAADVAGMVDPTPASDLIGAGLAVRKGDWLGAGMSLVSVVPYLGDAVAKPAKAVRAAKRINELRQTVAKLTAKLTDLRKAEKQAQAAEATAKEAKIAERASAAKPFKQAANGQKASTKGEKSKDCEDCSSDTDALKKGMPRPYKVTTTHRLGNRQVLIDGQRWNVPKGTDISEIPENDVLGNRLQELASEAGRAWNPRRNLSPAEREAIADARSQNEHWRANLLEQQAKGRWIENKVRNATEGAGFNVNWNRKGVDVVDPSTGLRYDIMSGSKSNMDTHAKRMPNELFRMITF